MYLCNCQQQETYVTDRVVTYGVVVTLRSSLCVPGVILIVRTQETSQKKKQLLTLKVACLATISWWVGTIGTKIYHPLILV